MSRQTAAGEATVTQGCAAFGLSRGAYYAARRPARAPEARVVRLPQRPRHASAEAVLAAIRAVVEREPAWGVRKVWATLRRDGLRVSRRRVWALMPAQGLVLVRDREHGKPIRGHVASRSRTAASRRTSPPPGPGTTGSWRLSPPDCGCRSLWGLEVTTDQTSPTVLASIEAALVAAFGSPETVPKGVDLRSDHRPQSTGADGAALVARWGLTHTFAAIGRPTGNAVVQRLIRTMEEDGIWPRDCASAAELREALRAWMLRCNTARPHQALQWQTPAERRAERLGRGVLRPAAA